MLATSILSSGWGASGMEVADAVPDVVVVVGFAAGLESMAALLALLLGETSRLGLPFSLSVGGEVEGFDFFDAGLSKLRLLVFFGGKPQK